MSTQLEGIRLTHIEVCGIYQSEMQSCRVGAESRPWWRHTLYQLLESWFRVHGDLMFDRPLEYTWAFHMGRSYSQG